MGHADISTTMRYAHLAPEFQERAIAALEAYGGVYQHPAYGRVTIQAEGDALIADYNGTPATQEHFHYDAFKRSKSDRCCGTCRCR